MVNPADADRAPRLRDVVAPYAHLAGKGGSRLRQVTGRRGAGRTVSYVFCPSYFKSKIISTGLGVILRVTSCVHVTEDTVERGEDVTFCAIWRALPRSSVCSPPTSRTNGRRAIPAISKRQQTSSRHLVLPDRGRQAVRDGEGEALARTSCARYSFFSGVDNDRHASNRYRDIALRRTCAACSRFVG
jgi:hypothetical protein